MNTPTRVMRVTTEPLRRLEGARAAHTLTPAVVAMVANALDRHERECRHHMLGGPVCDAYRDALAVLGIGGAR